MSQLLDAIEQLAGTLPALVLTPSVVQGSVLDSLRTAASTLLNRSVASNMQGVMCRALSLSVDPKMLGLTLAKSANDIVFKLDKALAVTFALHVDGNPTLEFSQITYAISDASFPVTGADLTLTIDKPECTVTSGLTESSTRQQALKSIPGREKELERLEGALTYLFQDRVLGAVFGDGLVVDLKRTFPGLNWHGTLRLELVQGALVIIPVVSATVAPKDGCSCDSVGGPGSINASQPHHTSNGADWDLSATIPPLPAVGIRPQDGFVDLYMPQPVLATRFTDNVFPALFVQYSDNGFLGYDVGVTVALKNAALRIDTAKRGLIVALDLFATGDAHVTVDVPCVGRVRIAYTDQFDMASSHVELLLRPTVQNGVLGFRSDVDVLQLGKVVVDVVCFGGWLAFAGGVAAIVGFIVDHVIDAILIHNLPIKIREGLLKALNDETIPLIDLSGLAPYVPSPLVATYDGKSSCVLVGMTKE